MNGIATYPIYVHAEGYILTNNYALQNTQTNQNPRYAKPRPCVPCTIHYCQMHHFSALDYLSSSHLSPHILCTSLCPSLPLLHLLHILLDLLIRIFDSQTPNIQIIANRPNNVNNKAAVDSDRQSQTHEHERNLIYIIAQRARPPEPDTFLQPWAERVSDAVDERVDEDVAAGEARFGEVRDDDSADGVGVYQAGVEDEGDEVVV